MDLIFVTHNSEKWISRCFDSLLSSDYRLEKLNVFVIDNASSDGTVPMLEQYRNRFFCCGSYQLLLEDKNHGFGRANNIAAGSGHSEIVVFVNIDTEFFSDTLSVLEQEIKHSHRNIGIWEMRQFPYEHPKIYDPVTLETSWSSGAAFAVRRAVYEHVGGFDALFFMYAEDVDFSWRVRDSGYKIRYTPRASIRHYTYSSANEIKPLQYCCSIINDLYLRYRYGSLRQQLMGNCRVISRLLHREVYKGARRDLIKYYLEHFGRIRLCRHPAGKSGNAAKFVGFEYEDVRLGAFYFRKRLITAPSIAVIIKNDLLSDIHILLSCLKNQTYPSIKWYFAGHPFDAEDIELTYLDLEAPISTLGEPYFSIVDEQFLYYADHFETLISSLVNHSCLGARDNCRGADQTPALSGIVFRSAALQSYDKGISFSDLYECKDMEKLFRHIICIDAETRRIWRH